ncbi:hypothetical protein QQP08_021946 [Theobroma cacao]|nr:hypothetical protein QQP08_021946 [Theobroma cacao]
MVETKLFKSVLPFCKFCVALLVPSIVLTSFIGLGFCSILFTITILVSSTIFLVTLTNKKRRVVVLEQNPVSKDLSVGEAEEKVLQPVIETSNLPPILPESIFKQQQDLVDFLAEINEVNEEENLIEIDISIGSIKCPRFEIEA